jgi:hemerythrin-like metal-binding protein
MSVIDFKWNESMSVGESTIDSQHQKLLGQLNKLIAAMAFGVSSSEVTEALSFFEMYVDEHLEYEEKYMKRRKYFDLDKHKLKHDDFRIKYVEFKKKFNTKNEPLNVLIEMEQFLGKWWLEHIGFEDKKFFIALGKDGK